MKQKALQPVIQDNSIEAQLDSEEALEVYLSKFVHYSRLQNKRQRLLIKAYAEDLVSGKCRTDVQISEDINLPIRTLGYYKADPDFAVACGFIMANLTASNSGQIISKIREANDNGSWNAGKFLLELAGVYTQKLQTSNVNVNLNEQMSVPKDFDEAVDELLIALGGNGWSAARIVDRFNDLRASGAF